MRPIADPGPFFLVVPVLALPLRFAGWRVSCQIALQCSKMGLRPAGGCDGLRSPPRPWAAVPRGALGGGKALRRGVACRVRGVARHREAPLGRGIVVSHCEVVETKR